MSTINIYKVLLKVLTQILEKTLDENQPREQAGFRSRYSTTDIFKGNIGTWLKRQVCNSFLLPAMTYGAETFTTQTKNKLAAAHTKMERSMLNITYWDKKINTWVREKAKVTDVIEQVIRRKWTWGRKMPREKSARRWRDEL